MCKVLRVEHLDHNPQDDGMEEISETKIEKKDQARHELLVTPNKSQDKNNNNTQIQNSLWHSYEVRCQCVDSVPYRRLYQHICSIENSLDMTCVYSILHITTK